ncbi:MAG: hypothetical protein AMJ76_01950 [Dehalococcoidia bacterium SM23_28_1]|nr:MAG: hypothetical protein AMJ76_01950 [Dehalococcoidia bacterium SM23_28_1]
MRGRLWLAIRFGVSLPLLAILVSLNLPRDLKAEPTDQSIAAVVGQPYTLGVENTSLRVQNAGLFPATVIVDYHDADGVRIAQDRVDDLASGDSAVFDQAEQPDLPAGFAGSAVVTADQPIKTVILKYVEQGDVLSLGGDDSPSAGFNRIYLPLIYSRFGPNGAWNTRFALQNVSTGTTACVQMTYRSHDGTTVFSEPAADALPDPQCPNGGLPLPAGGTILRNQANMTEELPEQFEGSLILETVANDAEPSPALLAAGADIFTSDQPSFASYKGLGWEPSGTGDLSTSILLPLVFKNFGDDTAWNTTFAVSTADPTQLTEVTITYCCDERLPEPDGSLRKTLVMQASAVIPQDLEAGLPDGFVGSAVITAEQPLAVVQTMASALPDKASFGAFVGIPQSTASTTVWLPVLYKDFGWKGPLGDAAGWNSWFRVQVANGGTANVQVAYYGNGLDGGSVSFSDSVTGSGTFDQHTDPLLPADFEGAAVITSNVPIAVVAGITSDAHQGDADALFAGFGPELFPGQPPPETTVPVSLVHGWNTVCYRGPQQPVEDALANALNSVMALYRLRPDQRFDKWFAGRPELTTITALGPYDSLFVFTGTDVTWQQEISSTALTSVTLESGWNSVCYAGPAQDIESAVAGINSQVGVIYALAADQTWSRFIPARPEISNLTQLEQFNSVLVLVTDPSGATWTFTP